MYPVSSGDQIIKNDTGIVQPKATQNRDRRNRRREAVWLRGSDRDEGRCRPQSQSRWCRQRDSGLRQVPSLLRPRMRGVVVVGQTPLGCDLDFQRMGLRPMGHRDTIVTNDMGGVQPMAVGGEKLFESSTAFVGPRCPLDATSPRACAAL